MFYARDGEKAGGIVTALALYVRICVFRVTRG